jgi:hypothetical protein
MMLMTSARGEGDIDLFASIVTDASLRAAMRL